MAVNRAMILLGRCVKASRENGVEVVVTMRELDTYLNMYFPEKYTFFAYDVNETCKPGDLVIMKKRDEPLTRKITHDISKIVYRYGDVVDPLTGKRVIINRYRENIHKLDRMFAEKDGGGFTKYLDEQRTLKEQPPAPKPTPSFTRRRHRKLSENPKDTEE